MEVTTEMENGTEFTYNNGKFTAGEGKLVISKPYDIHRGKEISLNNFEIMHLFRFITEHLIKISD